MELVENINIEREKSALLFAINDRMSKIDFVIKNKKYYGVSDFIIEDLLLDYKVLDDLRKRIFIIDLKKEKESR